MNSSTKVADKDAATATNTEPVAEPNTPNTTTQTQNATSQPQNNVQPAPQVTEQVTIQAAPTNVPDSHWIQDVDTGVYLWNPEPKGNETISWSGGYVQVGQILYANGPGRIIWYRDGNIIQVDDGSFLQGRHHGRFRHQFPSGNVEFSNWNNGVEIPY